MNTTPPLEVFSVANTLILIRTLHRAEGALTILGKENHSVSQGCPRLSVCLCVCLSVCLSVCL